MSGLRTIAENLPEKSEKILSQLLILATAYRENGKSKDEDFQYFVQQFGKSL